MNQKLLGLISISLAVLMIVVFVMPSMAMGADIKDMVTKLAENLGGLAAALSTIAFIIAGIMFLSATGNPGNMSVAKGALIAGVIGIVIVLLSSTACDFVNGLFGNPGTC